eukprot:jgi/Phyca11/99312/e_gw1.3.722.1
MSTTSVSAGAIAFLGPAHVPSLDGFTYVRVTKVQGGSATVRKTGPDDNEENPEFDVKASILRHRIVDTNETELWPGSYVGQPIAFVQSEGVTSDRWDYGLVSGYSMQDNTAILHLLDRQNEIIVACGKSRSGLPSSILSTMLSVPFVPDEKIPLIRPDTLEIVFVRRQHVVDCELGRKSSSATDVFTDPQLAQPDTSATSTVPTNASANARETNTLDLVFSDSEDETKTDVPPPQQADIDLVRLQNRPLRKRNRDTEDQDILLSDDDDIPSLPVVHGAHSSSFRPSAMEQYVHDAVVHPSLIGKNAQGVLESVQQGPRTQFLATPPVLRLSYDFSFGVRGLSVMHFRRFHQEIDQQSTPTSPATPPKTISDLVEALQTLLLFADGFYNSTVCNFIKAGVSFMEQFALSSRPDAAICNSLVSWIDSKLGKFRGELIASNLQTAALIAKEFTRNDDRLMERVQAHHERQLSALVAAKVARAPTGTRQTPSREHRAPKPSTVPRELLAMLPKQGNKTLCMRYLSNKGCSGPAPGQCFDPNRAHFKPLALPADAKTFIDKNFLGLAQEFQDL